MVLLSACGGEREEPFDPGEPEEEFRERVNTFLLVADAFENFEFPLTDTNGDGKRLEIIDNIDDFEIMLNAYDSFVEAPDFELGQVVLYDGGWIDDSLCEQQLDLRRLEAHSIVEDDSLVEVTLSYRRNEADEEADCPGEILLYRSFEFHYIETRADIVIVENVEGISDGFSDEEFIDSESN